jgi:hypothetical protein
MRSGWFREPYRHYLAAKGVKTKYYSRKYMHTQYLADKEKVGFIEPGYESLVSAVEDNLTVPTVSGDVINWKRENGQNVRIVVGDFFDENAQTTFPLYTVSVDGKIVAKVIYR